MVDPNRFPDVSVFHRLTTRTGHIFTIWMLFLLIFTRALWVHFILNMNQIVWISDNLWLTQRVLFEYFSEEINGFWEFNRFRDHKSLLKEFLKSTSYRQKIYKGSFIVKILYLGNLLSFHWQIKLKKTYGKPNLNSKISFKIEYFITQKLQKTNTVRRNLHRPC